MGSISIAAGREPSSIVKTLFDSRKALRLLLQLLFLGLLGSLLFLGLLNRTELIWTAEHGWGYGFGIVGGVMMLLLLLYPLSKHWKLLTRRLPIKFWFRLHMTLGLLGPAFILMHSSFQLGSTNSSVALFCMSIVATSGLFGRYFYTRIHHGLYGKKASFESLRADSAQLNMKLGPLFEGKHKLKTLLREHETLALAIPKGLHNILILWISTRIRAARLYPAVIRGLELRLHSLARQNAWDKATIKHHRRHARRSLSLHKKLIRQTQELHFYERLFAIWHHLHVPLFLMLIITGCVHVYAVHAY